MSAGPESPAHPHVPGATHLRYRLLMQPPARALTPAGPRRPGHPDPPRGHPQPRKGQTVLESDVAGWSGVQRKGGGNARGGGGDNSEIRLSADKRFGERKRHQKLVRGVPGTWEPAGNGEGRQEPIAARRGPESRGRGACD
ncbi:unnamed protein product [Rangifer tarandus platyrhynchus]|uniref:Uncharacterized protein n=1 Tax=Rangifer tarandus platyrhynchus TaxID=3082113 RepID=A0ABN8YSV0_RANTA|nr:unnamed protein product [Rangifer tarandus platyrhynchus]